MTTTFLDRVVRWNLHVDDDWYGDERERYRWYEGIATAASMQWIAVPWAAAIMVWPLGRPSVVPLAVVLVAMMLPMWVCMLYVRRRRVETLPRSWNAKRVFWGVVGGIPYAVFLVGALYAFDPGGATWKGAAVGGVFGGVIGLVVQVVQSRRLRRAEALAVDED
ncbi:hypothetical protein [Actinoplanes sp. M2I2]|uniref:hypothetical protein n=1 Tax=Actinoplanes sp. M2I2 TaxID=1734444 RepID=UPI00202215F8|nr:hypothetical protein [Actinoplanes sp. M2I2]